MTISRISSKLRPLEGSLRMSRSPRLNRHLHGLNGPALADLYLLACSILLFGYALCGKGLAYVGIAPVYLGELYLFFGLVTIVIGRAVGKCLREPKIWLLFVFSCWGAIRTVPYLDSYGVDALRDAAIWGYSVFALIVAGLLLNSPHRLRHIIARFNWFCFLFPFLVTTIYAVSQLYPSMIPLLPGTNLPIFVFKPGDVLVHFAGIIVFLMVGLAQARLLLMVPILAGVGLFGSQGRGGLLSFAAVVILVSSLVPFKRSTLKFWALAVFGFVASGSVQLWEGEKSRATSVQQVAENLVSIFSGEDSAAALAGTKRWRIAWWETILGYTLYGEYFWSGRGFGPNLADEDGFQVADDRSLRSPHSCHMTILARSGVPGLLLWSAVHAVWAAALLRAILRSRKRRELEWNKIFVFLLAYWLAAIINASFDVYLEGPMGAIWMWTIYGIGIAAIKIHRNSPELLTGRSRIGDSYA